MEAPKQVTHRVVTAEQQRKLEGRGGGREKTRGTARTATLVTHTTWITVPNSSRLMEFSFKKGTYYKGSMNAILPLLLILQEIKRKATCPVPKRAGIINFPPSLIHSFTHSFILHPPTLHPFLNVYSMPNPPKI